MERTAALNRLAAAVENVTEAVIITDPSWHIAYTNPAFTRYTGYTVNEAAGRELSFLRSKSVDRSIYDQHRKAALEDRPYMDQQSIRKKDGSHLAIESVMSRLKDDTGKTANYVLVWRDVSEHLRLEEQLRQSQKMEAVGKLAGGIAHDFNNMLAVILGNAELALDDHDLAAIQANLRQIIQASKRSRDLVRQILTFSRKSEGDRQFLRLIPVVQETGRLLRGSLPTTINIKVDIRSESDTILGNSAQLQQILMNLATNAAYAMREDGGTLAIRLSEQTFLEGEPLPDPDLRPGSYLKLTVRDTGTGIPSRLREHIFEPFFTTKDPGEGTGMGLAVVYGIVKSHEGAITVASRAGKGSVFSIFFPSVHESVHERAAESRVTLTGRERLLVVDDEQAVLEVVSGSLRRLGYEVTAARSGGEGWKMFERDRHAFDLVITDHVMPKVTGMRLAEMMLAARPDLPVILFTGYSETVSAEKAKAAGIAAFITKPVDIREMADTVRRVLDGRKRESER
jgi:PAS domain S-box-containing protein